MDKQNELDFLFDLLDVAENENEAQKNKLKLTEGERREVTILFADVKNSTAMGSKLDPELFHRKLNDLMKRFTKCITYYGGYVDKYMGDGIMALFGAKKATEQDTERAVLAALKMIEQTSLYNNKLLGDGGNPEESIGIRIGINTGLVLVSKVGEAREGDFTVTGAAVHLAQRMEANAPVGKILLPVHAMQAVERYFEFDFYAHVQAKGFSAPVEAYCVKSVRLEKGQRWFRRKAVFIGREKEMSLLGETFVHLERKLQGMDDGKADTILIGIRGDAGLGKTRLVNEFYQNYQNRMKLVSCVASGIVRTPFYIFINLLEGFFGLSINEAQAIKRQKLEEGFVKLTAHLNPGDAAELDVALPLVGALLEIAYNDPRLKQSGSELLLHLRLALQVTLKQILIQQAGLGLPLVLVMDDLHWMDESSAAIFANIIPNLLLKVGAPLQNKVLVLMQYRTDYVVPEAIRSMEVFNELELNPLSDLEIVRLLKHHTADYTVPDEVLAKVKLLSMGNPFYLEEWCNYLGDLQKHDLSDLPIPANLHALILSRLDMLDSSIRILLQKASVIGQEFFVDILSWIEDKLFNPIDVVGTLSQLEQQAFILKLIGFDYSAYFFKHITTRDVAYQTLLLENRAILHKLAAEAIEELYADRRQEFLFPLAEHYHRAEVKDKAVFYLEKAAAAAQKVFSNRQAIELYEKLLSWVLESDAGTLASAGRSTGFSRYNANEDEANKQVYSATGGITPSRILINLTEIKLLIGLWDMADADIQQAFTYAVDISDRFDCHRLKGISSFRRGNMDAALLEWETCLELATSQPLDPSTSQPLDLPTSQPLDSSTSQPLDSSTPRPLDLSTSRLAAAHNNLGIWYQHHKEFDIALQHHHRSLNYARELKDTLRLAKTLSNLGLMYLNQKDFPNAEKHLSQCLEIAEANQYLQLMSIALGNLGLLHYKQGAFDRAMHYYEKKWLLVDKLDDKAELIKVLGNIANVHRDKDQHREALEYYRKVLVLKEGLGNAREIAITHYCIAEELFSLGDVGNAVGSLHFAVNALPDGDALREKYQQRLGEIEA